MSVRVILNEPNALLRGVFREALEEQGFAIVAECAGAEEVLATVSRVDADVLITNVVMRGPVADGYELTARLRADRPELPVFILTAYPDGEHLERARRAGARGFHHKNSDLDSLIAGLRAVAAGGTWFGDEPG
jgi:DNA-binding NarL/FixJ family response regulator